MCISRFRDKIRRKKCRQDACGDLFSVSLKTSIRTKAIESYILLEKQIFPLCGEQSENRCTSLHLIVVIDEEASSAEEAILADLAKSKTSKQNSYGDLKRSLRRLKGQIDAGGKPYFYDQIDVMSCQEFSKYLHSRVKEI